MNVFRRLLFIIIAGLCLLLPGSNSFAASATKKKAPKPPPAPITGQVDGYRGIWFTLGQFTKHGDKYSGGLGTYTANHTPMAVYSPQADKTFFTYGGTVKGQRHLLVMASCFDHKTGHVPRPTISTARAGRCCSTSRAAATRRGRITTRASSA